MRELSDVVAEALLYVKGEIYKQSDLQSFYNVYNMHHTQDIDDGTKEMAYCTDRTS